MLNRFTLAVVLVSIAAASRTASAQAINVPPNSMRGLFGGPVQVAGPATTTNELTVNLNMSGGVDETVYPPAEPGAETPVGFTPLQSGQLRAAAAAASYRRGNSNRYFTSSGSASFTRQKTVGGEFGETRQEMLQADARVQASTTLGRRAGIDLSVSGSYEPMQLFNAFAAANAVRVQALSEMPGAPQASVDTDGISLERWIVGNGALSMFRNLTSRQRLEFGVDVSDHRPLEGPGFESRSQTGSLLHEWSPGPNIAFETNYRYSAADQRDQTGQARPIATQSAEVAMRFSRRLSPTRQLTFLLGGGAARTVTQFAADDHRTFTSPVMTGSAYLVLSPGWTVSVVGTRNVSVLDTLTPEQFVSDSGVAMVSGGIGGRLRLSAGGNYSRGASEITTTGNYRIASAHAQLEYGLTRYLSAVTTYTFYRHILTDIQGGSTTVPNQYRRNSIRVGVATWLPLYGIF